MFTVERNVVINRPIEQVFTFVSPAFAHTGSEGRQQY